MRPGFTGAGIDRADHLRLDEARLAELAASLEARLLRLDGLDPELDEQGLLRWDKMARAEERIFLGLREGIPLFAPLIRVEPGQRAWAVFALLEPHGGRRHGRLGYRPKPDRMAQPPSILRRLRDGDNSVPGRLGAALPGLRARAFPARRPRRDHDRRA